MKFSELENRVATLNLGTSNRYYAEGTEYRKTVIYLDYGIRFDIRPDSALYVISEEYVGRMQDTNSAISLPVKDRLALQKLAYKYSRTPIDERRDEPKFRVRMMPNLPNQNSSLYYVNYSLKNSEIDVGPDVDMSEDPLFRSKCHFTKKEYVSIQREFPEWLPKFDKDDPHFEIVEGGLDG